jgi:hypothetical protein
MSYTPFRKRAVTPATVAIPAIVQGNQAQVAAIELRQSALVPEGYLPTVAISRSTIAAGDADIMDTVATIATIAGPYREIESFESWQQRVRRRTGQLLGPAIPLEQAEYLAKLYCCMLFNPYMDQQEQQQAEAAFKWLLVTGTGEAQAW